MSFRKQGNLGSNRVLANLASTTLVVASVLIWYFQGLSYLEWPTGDMVPFFVGNSNLALASQDFSIAAASALNPRHAFGYLVLFLTRWLGLAGWEGGLFFLKSLTTMGIPLVFFKIYAEHLSPKRGNLLVLYAALLVAFLLPMLWHQWSAVFTICGWYPWSPHANAHWITNLIFSIAIALLWKNSGTKVNFALFVVGGVTGFLHPAAALCCLIFFVCLLPPKEIVKKSLCCFLGILFATGYWLALTFDFPKLELSQLIEHYVRIHHPMHYDIRHLPNRLGFPWWVGAMVPLFSFVSILVIAQRRKQMLLRNRSLRLLCAFSLAIFMQFFFIDVFPIRAIVLIGPSRLLGFIYYGLVFCLLELLFHCEMDRSKAVVRFWWLVFPLAWIFTLSVSPDVKKYFHSFNPKLANWIHSSTPENSVFSDGQQSEFLWLVAERASFVGNGFPFREEYIVEFSRRKQLLYGGNFNYEDKKSYYESLSLDVIFSEKIDYAIKPVSYLGKTNRLPVYQDEEVAVFSNFSK